MKLNKDPEYKNYIYNTLYSSVDQDHIEDLKLFMDDIIYNKIDDFKDEFFETKLYYDEDKIIDLILPAVYRVYKEIYIKPPTLFEKNQKKMQIYHLLFDIDYFIEYYVKMLKESQKLLESFKYIDKTPNTIRLIIDNYVGYLFEETQKIDSTDSRIIRKLKLKKILKNVQNK